MRVPLSVSYLLILALALFTPTGAWSASELPAWLEKELKTYRLAKTPNEYIDRSTTLRPAEKDFLRAVIPSDAKLPPLKVFKNVYLTFQTTGLTLRLLDSQKRLIEVNGNTLTVPDPVNIITLSALIGQKAAVKSAWWWPSLSWLPSAEAKSGSGGNSVDVACLSQLKNTWDKVSSLPTLAKTDIGYAPFIWIPNLLVEAMEYGLAYVPDTSAYVDKAAQSLPKSVQPYAKRLAPGTPSCADQAKALEDILQKNRLAIRELDCGSEWDGSDQSITFWTDKMNDDSEPKTRSFNLDYTRGMAFEADDDEGDGGKNKVQNAVLSEKAAPLARHLYIFDTFSLTQAIDYSSADGHNSCKTHSPQDATFTKIRSDIEPFRQVFYYLRVNRSCLSCAQEMKLKVESPTLPDWLKKQIRGAQPSRLPVEAHAPRTRN